MTMTIPAIVAAIQDVALTVAGIRAAPDVPPEQLAESGNVLAVCYPGEGEMTLLTAGRQKGNHTLHLSVFTAQRNMAADWARVIALGDAVATALLANSTLAGSALQIERVRYTFGSVDWAGHPMFGWLFVVSVMTTGSIGA